MTTYILRRVAYIVPLWIALSVLSFTLGQLAPGDPARSLLQRQLGYPPTQEEVDRFSHQLGLDDSAVVQYGRWVTGAVQGDLGISFRTGDSVFNSLRRAFPVTVELALVSFVLAVAIAIPLGVLAALQRGSLFDHCSRIMALSGASLPTFWFGYLLIIVFSVKLQLFPSQGSDSVLSYVLPSVTLAVHAAGVILRLTRASMLEVLGEDFVRAARSRGLPHMRVVCRHALRVALNPVVTYAGLLIGGLLGGAVIVETVFGMPGVGKLVVDAISDRDFPIVQGFVLYFGSLVLVINLVVDVLYISIDPRVRLIPASGRAPSSPA